MKAKNKFIVAVDLGTTYSEIGFLSGAGHT